MGCTHVQVMWRRQPQIVIGKKIHVEFVESTHTHTTYRTHTCRWAAVCLHLRTTELMDRKKKSRVAMIGGDSEAPRPTDGRAGGDVGSFRGERDRRRSRKRQRHIVIGRR
jgi:hypothetical protein